MVRIESDAPDPLHHRLGDAFPSELLAALADETPDDEEPDEPDAGP